MKKAVSLVVVLVLVFGCSVMALADFVPMPPNPEAYDPEYIPAIPDFIQQLQTVRPEQGVDGWCADEEDADACVEYLRNILWQDGI